MVVCGYVSVRQVVSAGVVTGTVTHVVYGVNFVVDVLGIETE